MANDLVEVERDSIDYATEGLSPVRGVPLKFDTTWYRGFEKEAANTKQDYLVTDMSEAWGFIKKGCPVEYVVREPGSPTRPPRPDTFTEKESWPVYNGEHSDPWRYNSIIHIMALENGETFNYVSPTAGAWICRDELLEQIKSMRQLQPGCLPIVRLASTAFTTKYGTRQRPMLRIAGWQRPKAQAEEPKLLETEVVEEPKKLHSKAKTPVAEMATTVNAFNDCLPDGM